MKILVAVTNAERNEMLIKAGEVHTVLHSRKGKFSALFLSDYDTEGTDDTFIDVQIVEGRAKFISVENMMLDAGATGNIISMRRSLFSIIPG